MKARSAKKKLGSTVAHASTKTREHMNANPVWSVPADEVADALAALGKNIVIVDPGESHMVFETTSEAALYNDEEHFDDVRATDPNEFTKCPHLWPKESPKFKARSDAILEPIRGALRARSWLRVIWRGAVAAQENELPRENMIRLFGDHLGELERELGQLLLTAVCTGDDNFKNTLAAALKDADELFHRGKALDAFFRWKHTLAPEVREAMTIGEIKEAFITYLGRDELSGSQWKRIKEEFALQNTTRGKPGPRAKMRKRKLGD